MTFFQAIRLREFWARSQKIGPDMFDFGGRKTGSPARRRFYGPNRSYKAWHDIIVDFRRGPR